ncbi:PTCB-BRCT domain-containing protein [Rhizoctonia solani AG-1 IA]|uniref:PTCB-BRCT domain-containing protein n=1 Tax=Thanatephorus cucumeris (strain AG1-IA) TaxID=983506 RepID=L8WY45_THACA|nr:PTCB-BRCT domain-containing protein [Rhizoctonia solani AG-1 IA]
MPSADRNSDGLSQLFSGVHFFIAQGLPTAMIDHLRELLVERGGLEVEHTNTATHVISSSDCFIGVDDAKEAIIVTGEVSNGILSSPRYFSADPHKIFSGVVATSSDIPLKDSESIAAGIVAFGGQWKEALTNDVTHLFCLSESGVSFSSRRPKYAKALNTQGHPLQIQVVVTHWFSDCFKSETLLSTKNYLFPNPPILNPDFNENMVVEGVPENTTDDSKAVTQRGLLRAAIGTDLEPNSNSSTQPSNSKSPFSNRVLGGKRVVFSARAVQSDPNRDHVYRRRVEQVGGTYISGLSLGGDGVSEETLKGADIFITSYRGNHEYDLAHPPGSSMSPTQGYGRHRESIFCIIPIPNIQFPDLKTRSSQLSIAMLNSTTIPPEQARQNKISKAREWRIPIVNHLWLEDCFREWKKLPTSDQKYLNFPQGHDWMQDINTKGVGNGNLPPVPAPQNKKSEVAQDPHSARAPNTMVDDASRPISPSKPMPTSKPASPRRSSDAGQRARNGVSSNGKTPQHTSPSKSTKPNSVKRKNDISTSQSAKRPKMARAANDEDTPISPSKSTGKQLSDSTSAASSSSFIKPLSEVQPRSVIKLLSPDKGKHKSRKSSSDDERTDHHSDSSSSSERSIRRKPSPPSMSAGGRTPRAAATAAQNKLRNEIMPDVQKFQNEMSSSKGDVRKMQQLAEKKQRRTSIVNHDDDAPPPKKKKHGGDDDGRPKKSQVTKSSQGQNEAKKESEKVKSITGGKSKPKASEDVKAQKPIMKSPVRIVCSKSKPTESEIKQMERLGASFTEDDPSQCTHLVVNSISRTEKFLCAFPVCKYIVTMRWLQDSIKEGKLQDEAEYKLSDPDNEKRYSMSLSKSLKLIKENKGKLLEGHTFYVTDNVGAELKSIQRVIESSGGVVKLEPKPTKKKIGNDMKHNHVISSQDAKASWQTLIKEDVPIYSKEFVLNGILRQRLDWSADRIH